MEPSEKNVKESETSVINVNEPFSLWQFRHRPSRAHYFHRHRYEHERPSELHLVLVALAQFDENALLSLHSAVYEIRLLFWSFGQLKLLTDRTEHLRQSALQVDIGMNLVFRKRDVNAINLTMRRWIQIVCGSIEAVWNRFPGVFLFGDNPMILLNFFFSRIFVFDLNSVCVLDVDLVPSSSLVRGEQSNWSRCRYTG